MIWLPSSFWYFCFHSYLVKKNSLWISHQCTKWPIWRILTGFNVAQMRYLVPFWSCSSNKVKHKTTYNKQSSSEEISSDVLLYQTLFNEPRTNQHPMMKSPPFRIIYYHLLHSTLFHGEIRSTWVKTGMELATSRINS